MGVAGLRFAEVGALHPIRVTGGAVADIRVRPSEMLRLAHAQLDVVVPLQSAVCLLAATASDKKGVVLCRFAGDHARQRLNFRLPEGTFTLWLVGASADVSATICGVLTRSHRGIRKRAAQETRAAMAPGRDAVQKLHVPRSASTDAAAAAVSRSVAAAASTPSSRTDQPDKPFKKYSPFGTATSTSATAVRAVDANAAKAPSMRSSPSGMEVAELLVGAGKAAEQGCKVRFGFNAKAGKTVVERGEITIRVCPLRARSHPCLHSARCNTHRCIRSARPKY